MYQFITSLLEILSEKKVKRVLEFKSPREEFFPSNYSLHVSLLNVTSLTRNVLCERREIDNHPDTSAAAY